MKTITRLLFLVFFGIIFTGNNYAQDEKLVNPSPKGQLFTANPFQRSAKLHPRLRSLVYNENFETGAPSWNYSGCWEIGQPTSGPNGGHNSPNCAATTLSGNYPNYANDWMISPSIYLPTQSNPQGQYKLNFWQWYALESSYDYGYVKISNDGGVSWNLHQTVNGSTGWTESIIDITSYQGDNIQIAFHLTSDGSATYEGWYFDDIRVEYEEPKYLTATITNLNSQNFPFIYMNVAVDTNGTGISTLNQSNFSVTENDQFQTNFFEVFPPDTGSSVRRADIVFIMDNSGSMEDEQLAVENNVIDFVDNLTASGVDFALGLCRYGQYEYSGTPIIEDNGILTSDASYFKYDVWQRNLIDGGNEPGYYAIVQSSNGFAFRPGTQKIFIIITDEYPDQGYASMQEALNSCVDNSVTLFALTTWDIVDYFIPITDATNGAYFDIYSNFDEILDAISSQVASSYLVKYFSSDPAFNGIIRNVEVNVEFLGHQDTDSASYIPGDIPSISRTSTTLAYHNQAWAEGTSFNIEVEIIDLAEPFVNEAILYFRHTNTTVYQALSMSNTSGNLWTGIILGDNVSTPGIDYYITATDGISTSSDPSVDPMNSPYQIAILPNVAPVINHISVVDINVAEPVIIIAEIFDNTNTVEFVGVYYRKFGQLSYQTLQMTIQSGNNYSATIPLEFATEDGLEYYIWAVDNFGVGSYHGTPDDPHLAEATPNFADYLVEKQEIITNIFQINRPFYGFSKPFYNSIETQAQNFLTNVSTAYNNGTADPIDLEAIGRLTICERVTYRGLTDAMFISEYGAKGCKSIAFSFICKEGFKLVGNAIKHVPIIGEKLFNGIEGVNDKITHSLDKLNLAFHNGLAIPPGTLSPEQLNQAISSTNQGLSESNEAISEFVIENGLSAFNLNIFDTGEDIIHDVLYMGTFEFQTSNQQQNAVNNAQSHLFPANSFNGAKAKTINTLFSMIESDETAMNLGMFINSINEASGWLTLGSALVLIIVGILGALISGGTSLLAAFAGIATLMVTYSAQINQTSAIVEAGGAAVYVNGIMPYVYMNPSVDDAFGNGSKEQLPEKVKSIMQNSNYKITEQNENLSEYFVRLRQRIITNDPTWATVGMDSLAYFESLVDNEDLASIAKFMASSENATYFIFNFDDLVNMYIRQSASYDILSGSLIISATVYEAGYTDESVISNALTSLDSMMVRNDKLIQNRNDINTLLLAYGISTPTAVGISKVSAHKQGDSEIILTAEITNFGSETASNIQTTAFLNNDASVVVNNNQMINLSGNSSKDVTFQINSTDTTLFGVMQLSPDPANPSYYVMPSVTFGFDYQALTYSVTENQSDPFGLTVFPNPFNPSSGSLQISFTTTSDCRLSVGIFNLQGQCVKSLFEKKFFNSKTFYEIDWNGRSTGDVVTNGIYFITVETESGEKSTKKIVVLR